MDTLEELKKQRAELDEKIKMLESTEQPFDRFQKYFLLTTYGGVTTETYDDVNLHNNNVAQGNAFKTEKAAELEAERRKLLHRFKMFRDKCNDWWKPNFGDFDRKYFIVFSGGSDDVFVTNREIYDHFNVFGYFKNEQDALKAIELFGDEIKRLYAHCEV